MRLRWLLAGYLFLLVFRPYEYWTFLADFRIERVYMLIFIAAVLMSKKTHFIASPINRSIFAFLLVLIASSVLGVSWDSSSEFLVDYAKIFIFYIVAMLSIEDEDDFRFIVVVFIAVMIIYVSKSAWEFFVNGRYEYRMGIRRMMGIDVTYGAPNSFAATICYSLPLAWALICAKFNSKLLRMFLVYYIFIAVISVVLTGSRSGLATVLLLVLLILLGSSKKIFSVIIVSILLVSSWELIPDDLQGRFLSTIDSDQSNESAKASADGRLNGFLHGVEVFLDNPVFGSGPNTYSLTWPGVEKGFNAHNVYGQILGELGGVGVLTFGLLVALIVRTNRLILKRCVLLPINTATKQSDASPAVLRQRPLPYLTIQADVGGTGNCLFHSLVARAIIQTIILLFFKGWGDHNLYRYNWIWLAVLTVLGGYFSRKEVKSHGRH